jgi:hypothetical protein
MATTQLRAETPNQVNLNVCPVVLSGINQKQAIVQRVIANRLPLLEAAALFESTHKQGTAILEAATGIFHSVADPEQSCRTVIGWVELALRDRPEKAQSVIVRLEKELDEILASNHSKIE